MRSGGCFRRPSISEFDRGELDRGEFDRGMGGIAARRGIFAADAFVRHFRSANLDLRSP
jgi:hypothetical protein